MSWKQFIDTFRFGLETMKECIHKVFQTITVHKPKLFCKTKSLSICTCGKCKPLHFSPIDFINPIGAIFFLFLFYPLLFTCLRVKLWDFLSSFHTIHKCHWVLLYVYIFYYVGRIVFANWLHEMVQCIKHMAGVSSAKWDIRLLNNYFFH